MCNFSSFISQFSNQSNKYINNIVQVWSKPALENKISGVENDSNIFNENENKGNNKFD